MQQVSKILLLLALLFGTHFGADPAPAQALAEDPSAELQAEARTSVVNVTDSTYVWIAVITGAIFLMSFSQIVSRSAIGGPSARNLFLGVKLKVSEGKPEQSAWVRALDTHSALLVSPKFLAKGDRVRVNLASLPDYPGEGETWVEAEVRRVRSLGGDPATFEVRLRFPRMTQKFREFLNQYVRRLAARGGLQHA